MRWWRSSGSNHTEAEAWESMMGGVGAGAEAEMGLERGSAGVPSLSMTNKESTSLTEGRVEDEGVREVTVVVNDWCAAVASSSPKGMLSGASVPPKRKASSSFSSSSFSSG